MTDLFSKKLSETDITVRFTVPTKSLLQFPIPSQETQTQFQTTATKFVLISSIGIAAFLKLLPYKRIGGNLVPTVLFNGRPHWMFHGLVISDIFAFTGAFCALLMGNEFKVGRVCSYFAIVAFASALFILGSVLFLDCILGTSASPD